MLTIVIPTTNRASLEKAIASVELQTVPTGCIAMFDESRIGAGPTRNQLIQQVTTPWVGFLDDDDTLDPHYHEWLLEESKDNDMVIFRMKVAPNLEDSKPVQKDVSRLELNDVGISFALRTRIAKKYPFRNMVGEDIDLIKRLHRDGYKVKVSDHVAYFVRNY